MGVDKMAQTGCIDEMGVDEMGVDEMGGNLMDISFLHTIKLKYYKSACA